MSKPSPPACPECRTPDTAPVDAVSTAELAQLYHRHGVEVGSYFDGLDHLARYRCAHCDLQFFAPACAGDDAFYEQLQQFDWYYQDEKPEYHHAAGYLQAGQRVLEVGCGKGAFHAFLPAGVAYVGLEFNDEAVRKANAAGLDVRKETIERHAAAHPGRYDAVCTFQVLEHVPRPDTFLDGCVAALADGGLLIVAVPAEDSFLAVAANAPFNMPPHHALRWTDRALRNMARRRRLDVVELWHEPVAPFHRDWQEHTLAHHYFALHGSGGARLVDTRLRYRAIGRLLRHAPLRAWLARRVAAARPVLRHGHTVVLVARKRPAA